MLKAFLSKSLLTLLLVSLSQVSFANGNNDSNQPASAAKEANKSEQQVKTFTLNLWSPEQVPPADAKLAEYGASYHYQYTPESHELPASTSGHTIAFKLHDDVKQRYQFRWLSADQPQFVSFEKIKAKTMKVNISPSETEQDIYFEVWLYDTLTGEVFMCDPRVKVKGPPP